MNRGSARSRGKVAGGKAAGMQRATRQRRAIERMFREQSAPITVAEALASAGRLLPGLSQATLYRAVHALMEGGQLERVVLPGEPPRYEWARGGHWHFFHCDQCRKVFEIAGCNKPGIDRVPRGFRVREHHVVLYGACSGCAAKPEIRRRRGGVSRGVPALQASPRRAAAPHRKGRTRP